MSVDVKKLLAEVLGEDIFLLPELDLVESGMLDSLAMIDLVDRLADEGVELQPTRVDRNKLRTVAGIEALVAEAEQAQN